jgi:UDP-N-acetylmuramate dehydrogenase
MLLYSDFSLKDSNTFNLAAKAEYYFEIAERQDLESFIRKRRYFEMPRIILGNGSNIVFSKDFKGVVLKNLLSGIEVLQDDDNQAVVKVSSGEDFDKFVDFCVKKHYFGLENLSGIPGTIGASAVQSIGAYGVDVKNYIQEVEYYDFADYSFKTIKGEDCKFGYRDSIFKNDLKDNAFVTSVTFKLEKKFVPILDYDYLRQRLSEFQILTPNIVRRVILAIRSERIPDFRQFGNAGSFFKNPELTKAAAEKLKAQFPELKAYEQENGKVKLAAGQLIDLCGFKKTEEGAKVGVAKNNALIMLNLGNATGKDILAYAKKIEKTVKEKFGIKLEPEVVIC